MFRRAKHALAFRKFTGEKECDLKRSRKQWEYYLIKGNEYYFKGQYEGAAYCYSIAVERLELVVSEACKQCKDASCLQHYLIACQNASHSFNMSGDIKKAELYLSRAHFKLLSLVTLTQARQENSNGDWQSLIHTVCEKSLTALIKFLELQGRKGAAESIRYESERLLG